MRRVEIAGCDAPAWAVAGPPGLCTLAARLGAFGAEPDLVVSGINAGLNTGRAILHSGTVGAALTAQNFGAKGLAVSVDAKEPWRWDTAATIALEVLDLLVEAPARSVLNLNVPALPRADVRGVRWARLAAFGAVRAAIGEATHDGALQIELRATDEVLPPDTDTALCDGGLRDPHRARRDRRVVAECAAPTRDRAAPSTRRARRAAPRRARRHRQPHAAQPRAGPSPVIALTCPSHAARGII